MARWASDERRGVKRAGAVLGDDAVLEHERGHALRVEPLGDLLALVVVGEEAVAAAGADHHRRAVGLRRLEDGDARLVGGGVADRVRRLAVLQRDDGVGGLSGEECQQKRHAEHGVSPDLTRRLTSPVRQNPLLHHQTQFFSLVSEPYNVDVPLTEGLRLGGDLVSTGYRKCSVACRG